MRGKTKVVIGIIIWILAAALAATAVILFVKMRSDDGDQSSAGSPQEQTAEDVMPESLAAQKPFGNVVCKDGNMYYWKYSNDSFSSDPCVFGYYKFDPGTVNQLVCRNRNGEERVLVSENGAGCLCIAGDRIYYQTLQSENNHLSNNSETFRLRSCSLTGDDAEEHGDGILLGLIGGGKYLIAKGAGQQSESIFSIDTATGEKTDLFEGHFLVCADDAVVCYRSDNTDPGVDEEETVCVISGDGLSKKDLYTETAATLPSVADLLSYNGSSFLGYITIDAPLIINNSLFYIYEHIDGSASVVQSARIMRVDMETGEAAEIPGSITKEVGTFGAVDIDSSDTDVIAYKNYISDYHHLNALDKADYSGFSDAPISDAGDESEILKVDFYDETGDTGYIFLTYGEFSDYYGWRWMFRFEKCALYEKNTVTGVCTLIYST